MSVGGAVGDGLGASQRFLTDVLRPLFSLDDRLEDGYQAYLPSGEHIVLTTDLFMVDPVRFPGGDLGKLAAAGVLNDLLASGARGHLLTLGILMSEELDQQILMTCLESLARECSRFGVRIIGGDTKTHTRRDPELVFALTGIGLPIGERALSLADAQAGDDLWITGPLGDHSIAVISIREGLGFERAVKSDCAVLFEPLAPLVAEGLIHAMRDLTRGGLVAAANDGVAATGLAWHFRMDDIPIRTPVRAAAEMLGLDPLALANEGSMLLAAPQSHRRRIADWLGRFPETADARIAGFVGEEPGDTPLLEIAPGDIRSMRMSEALGIPRLC